MRDIGMLHPAGFSVSVHGADGVKDAKHVILTSDDCYLEARRFEPYSGDLAWLQGTTVIRAG
jgi:hypothetical protein